MALRPQPSRNPRENGHIYTKVKRACWSHQGQSGLHQQHDFMFLGSSDRHLKHKMFEEKKRNSPIRKSSTSALTETERMANTNACMGQALVRETGSESSKSGNVTRTRAASEGQSCLPLCHIRLSGHGNVNPVLPDLLIFQQVQMCM